MSDCKAYRREIDEAADGRPVSSGTRAHVRLCRVCGDELRERESLRALVGGLGKVEAPADFEFRLRARMTAAKVEGGRGRFGGARWFYGFAPVAVAACFVIVSATLYFKQASRTNPSGASTVVSVPKRNAESVRATSDDAQGRSTKSTVANGEVLQESRTNVALSATHQPMRDLKARNKQAREVAFRNERRADSAQRTAIGSFTSARVLRPVTITLKASAEPLRMILRDERGATRVVPMRAVSFGSQDFLAREATIRPSGAAEVGGVW